MEFADIVAGRKYSCMDLIAPCNWGNLVVGTVLRNRVVVDIADILRRAGTARNLHSLVEPEEEEEKVRC